MTRPRNILIVLFLWLLTTSANAQDYRRQYRQAKDLFLAGNYSESMKAFQPLTIYDRENPYPEYASYYYAMSAYRLGFAAVAKDMLLQIRKLYPSWDQLDEVNFLLAAVYAEKGEVFQSLLVLSEIQRPTLVADALNLKRTL
ncbi:MAG: tetratricopeptide repeat protein, partial [Cyclobacteriaceae bacterium]